MTVPDPVVAAVAAAGLGAIDRVTPAGAGRRNVVWLVGLAAGPDVVVRLLADAARLAMEQSVIARVAAEGVPVAEVVWATADPVPVMVQRRLPGRRLSDVEATDALGAALASTMRAIHTVPIAGGFGTLTAELRGQDDRLTSWFTERVRVEVEAVVPDASADDRRRLEAALAVLEDARPLLDAQASGLAHGDVQPSNVLVDGTTVTGVLDWEAARACRRPSTSAGGTASRAASSRRWPPNGCSSTRTRTGA